MFCNMRGLNINRLKRCVDQAWENQPRKLLFDIISCVEGKEVFFGEGAVGQEFFQIREGELEGELAFV